MAIHHGPDLDSQNGAVNPPPYLPSDVEAWTAEAARSLATLSLSLPGSVRRTTEPLLIPLEEGLNSRRNVEAPHHEDSSSSDRPRREPLRRDSLKRREALLKGKEGSRRRQRWENDRLLNNPWAQPPLPSDWEVHPTYPKHAVPYYLAPLWDANLAARQTTEKRREAAKQDAGANDEGRGKVPKELREKLKKAKGAKGLLQALEEQVRKFVKDWDERATVAETELLPEVDSEDEEIVFVGRNGQMLDMPPSPKLSKYPDENDIKSDRLVFDSLADDRGANFGYFAPFNIPDISTDFGLGAGWFTRLGPIMDFAPGQSPSATRRDERPTSGSSKWRQAESLCLPLVAFLARYGEWSEAP
ncbi:hypothetical protein MMC07_007515 [Pseudocyphellaria aurata]|nr:hypothetical protein [Pseudocyphellaria aurata]